MPIEFSVETNCGPFAWASTSVLPRQGRIRAVSPVTRCARFSLVETCTVKRQRRNAAAVYSVSGVAEERWLRVRKILLHRRHASHELLLLCRSHDCAEAQNQTQLLVDSRKPLSDVPKSP